MDINDWANPEVVQLLEQYIQEPTESTKELQRKIQRITGKALTINKLRHHLQQFEKETAAYKEHSKKNETSVTVSSCQAGSRFEQRAQLPQEMSSSKPAEIDQREARTGHVPDDVQTVNSHTHKSQKVVRSIRKISTRRREELGMLRSYQKCKRKKSKNASSTTVSDKRSHEIQEENPVRINFRQKDLTATTACEGVKQEAAEQQKTVPPVKFITKSDETTVSPPDESAVLILSESSKSTVIKTQPERAILPAQSAIPASNIGTPECATALAIGPAIPALKILKISERAVLNTKSTDLVSDSPEWVVIIDTKLNVPPRNTLECVLDAEPTVPARTTPERVVLDAEPVNLVLDTPEHVALTTGPIVPIRNTVLATASVVPASNRDTPKREALDAEPTNLVSPVHVSSAIGSIIPVSNIPVVIGPSVPVSNIPECAVLVTGPITVVSNTPEYVVQATKPTVADATSCSQVTTGKNIAWYGSVVPQSIARGLTASESNRCAGRVFITISGTITCSAQT
uniref:INCENP_ARK-bind domain-containing protein n=1 Tax=Elaeophora elaphi TaxID=1147741 RepID=A0A0R3RZ11_9BILA